MIVSGIDDAGRGPVIGPLIIAGISINENDLPKLIDLGVRDSKLLSSHKRETLAPKIKELASNWYFIALSPHEIDKVVESKRRLHKLNRLEAQTMAKVIAFLRPDIVYVDASDILAKRFGDHIAEKLSFKIRIISEHKADQKYPIVSAASILAKVQRDKEISLLREIHGEIGCGYPCDPNTIKYLEKCIKEFGFYPNFVRKSWKTSKRIKSKLWKSGNQQEIF
ncbi:MAG: ribonuclease HII [Candidatus Bathyarchaeota archaeon]|jgi:ribonuclease HII